MIRTLEYEELLTPEEQNVIDNTVRVWASFLELPDQHRHDKEEMLFLIHQIQRIIFSRPALRARPLLSP